MPLPFLNKFHRGGGRKVRKIASIIDHSGFEALRIATYRKPKTGDVATMSDALFNESVSPTAKFVLNSRS